MVDYILLLKILFILILILLGLYVILEVGRILLMDVIDFKKYRIIQITKADSAWYEVQRWWFGWYSIDIPGEFIGTTEHKTFESAKQHLEQEINKPKQKLISKEHVKVVYKLDK